MIARLLRTLWVASLVVAGLAAWWSIGRFGPYIGDAAAGLAGFCAVYVLHPVFVAASFALSRRHGDPVPPDLRLSPARAVGMFDAEVDASVRGFWWANPFRSTVPAPDPDRSLAPRPVALLFVHGYFCNRAVWHPFLRDAAARGYVCEGVTLDAAFAPIESYAPAIASAVDALLERARTLGRGVDRVVVVAHSMGGLAIRAALADRPVPAIAHVITLGTPHRGTWSARFGTVANVVQMRTGSPWLADLDARERAGAGLARAACTCVYSAHDDIVYPQTTALLDGALAVRLGGIGHVSLLYDRRVRAVVFERLEDVATG